MPDLAYLQQLEEKIAREVRDTELSIQVLADYVEQLFAITQEYDALLLSALERISDLEEEIVSLESVIGSYTYTRDD
jgi:D-serine dehydratase